MRLFLPQALRPPRDVVPLRIDRQRPLWLEIGAGTGLHALACAAAHPEVDLCAIERTRDKFATFARALAVQPRANLTAIHADAIPWVVHALPPRVLARVFIFYPNPEPRNPAQRWLNMPFFAFLLSRMQDGASLVLASNIPAYVDEAEQQAREVWRLPVSRHAIVADAVGGGRSRFEQKYLQRGEPCAELRLVKPTGFVTPFDDWQAPA